MAEKTRYSDAELEEFRAIIMEKLELAQRDYDRLKSSIMNKDGNDTDDTSPTYKVLEEGANTLSKDCLLYTSPSPRDRQKSRMPSSA